MDDEIVQVSLEEDGVGCSIHPRGTMNVRARIYRIAYPLAVLYWKLFHPKQSGAGCVLEYGEKILLVRHTYGDQSKWSFPGGGTKKGETPIQTAIREVREEVGVDLSEVKGLGQFTNHLHGREDTVFVFSARITTDTVTIDPGEIAEARWFSREEASRLPLSYAGQGMYRLFVDQH